MLPDIELEIRELADQVKDGKKVIEIEKVIEKEEDGKKVTETLKRSVLLKLPNSEDELRAKREHSRAMGELLKDGNYQTESEMREIMKKRKIWTERDDEKLRDLSTRRMEQLNKYIISKTQEEKREALKKYNQLSEELSELQDKQSSLMGSTIESLAREVKHAHLVSRCAFDFDTGKLIWNSYDEYIKESDRQLSNQITYEFMLFYQNIPEAFLGRLPEETEESEQSGESDGE